MSSVLQSRQVFPRHVHAGKPSTSGRDQRDATPAAAKPSPRPRAKRSRELQGLLDFAGEQGIDVNPSSPRGRRSSREPSAKPSEEPILGGERSCLANRGSSGGAFGCCYIDF